MEKITKDDLLKLAALSQISVADNEVVGLIRDIESVLEHASSLKEIAAQGIPSPLPYQINVVRDDVSGKTAQDARPEDILAQAPERHEQYIVVPMILKKDS